MPLIDHIDGPTRRIYLDVSTINTEIDPMDIYKEMRTLRRTDEILRSFDVFLEASGNVAKGGGTFTPKLVTCLLGTRIVPYDQDSYITIIGEIITDNETSGIDAFDRTLLDANTQVDINYIPPQVEIIQVNSGSGLTALQATMLLELWKLQGLDITAPMTVTPNSRIADDIELDLTGDGVTTKTVTRV